MRKLVYSALPLGKGIIVDPFMGSGSTIAAAEAVGVSSIGVEVNKEFYALAEKSVLRLKAVKLTKDRLGKSSSVPSSHNHSELHLPL